MRSSSARFAAEDDHTSASINLNDRLVELVARSINDLPTAQRNQFRDELAGFLRYLRSRYQLATDDEIRDTTDLQRIDPAQVRSGN
jgi:hypothetical protein